MRLFQQREDVKSKNEDAYIEKLEEFAEDGESYLEEERVSAHKDANLVDEDDIHVNDIDREDICLTI